MITNERQYKITKSQLEKLQAAINKFDLVNSIERIGSKVLAIAELEGIKSEVEVLEEQVNEYENLKSGAVTIFKANNLDELPIVLIQARIAQQLSQQDLARLLGLKEQQIQRYESEKYASASLVRLRQVANALNLNITELAEINKSVNKSSSESIDWSKFPVKIMYRRGFFEGFYGSLPDLEQQGAEIVESYITRIVSRPSMAFHRKKIRSGSKVDEFALFAWECRVLDLASKMEINKTFSPELISASWLNNFRKLSLLSDGPVKAITALKDMGIAVVIEPHLPRTFLDGAALMSNDGRPVIGLTLRFDRVDNFWFVLLHELVHVVKHLDKNKLPKVFDDLECKDNDSIEAEADAMARDILISSKEWDSALPRFVNSAEAVRTFALHLGISPAIVAGRIRFEKDNHVILSDLVGYDGIRKLFPSVKFSL